MSGRTDKTRMVVVRCTQDLLQQVERVAAATQLSRAVVVQEAIAYFCDFWDKEGSTLQQTESESMLAAARCVLKEMQKKQRVPRKSRLKSGERKVCD